MTQGPDLPDEIRPGGSLPAGTTWLGSFDLGRYNAQINRTAYWVGVSIRVGFVLIVLSTLYSNVVEIQRLKDRVEILENTK